MDIEKAQNSPQSEPLPGVPALRSGGPEALPEATGDQNRTILIVAVVFIVLLAVIVGSIFFLVKQPLGEVARIRDIFIIFMAVQSLLTGLALVILLIQLARLINLLQNEVKPILDSTNETVSNLRGTTVFLSESLVEPVIKLNEYLAGLSQLFQVVGLMKRTSRKRPPQGE